ncbi:IgGFc-binding protein [Nannocystis pusilla]|uniref:IgGFc-binding protein n=1 Tax=Nannocystis pusilla TaxID=889268 RepID=A0ABS7TYM7_9BACT|nr:IgGFc-binding protein [Nannocystis pusilla]
MSTTRLAHSVVLSASVFVSACSDDGGRETATAASGIPTMPTLTTDPTNASAPSSDSESPTGTDSDGLTGTATASTTDTDGTPTSSTTVGPDPTSVSTTDTGDPTSASATSTGDPGPLFCSDDLHTVVDEQGNPVEQCAGDQACFDGACAPVCEVLADLQGTSGCDFWAPTPPFYLNAGGTAYDGPCFAVFLANAWSSPANIVVARGGQQIDVNMFGRIPKSDGNNVVYEPIPPGGLPPDEVAILFLSHKPGVHHELGFTLECPAPPAVLQDTAVPGTGIGQAFHIQSDVPVTAYDINPYGGARSFLPSASLLFPATTWGTNHMAIAPAPNNNAMFALVVAREDNTVIKVAPAANFPGGGGQPPAPAGVTTQYILNAGQILQWSQPGNNFDPSGAIFDSDKPIGLWTGSTYMFVASQTMGPGGGEAAHQQIAPVKAMGNEYVGAGVVTRLANLAPESVPYRLVGAVDDTILTYDPAPPPGAPTALSAGQVVQFQTTSFFTVRSQDPNHPFLFSQYMSGTKSGTRPGCASQVLNLSCGLGDEEWVSLLSPKQFQNRYVFFTDPTYGTTNLVIIRAKQDGVFADVTVECLGTVTGWQPVGAEGTYEVAHVDLERGNVPTGMCGTSRHLAESEGPFGVVVWGTDVYASYGYPAGSDIAKINEVELPVPQ